MYNTARESSITAAPFLPRKPFFSSQMKMWIISYYNDVIQVLKNAEKYPSVANYEIVFNTLELCPESIEIMNKEVPLTTARIATSSLETHTRIRNTVKKYFSNNKIEHFEENIIRIINKTIENFPQKNEIDLINDYVRKISLHVILNILGIPETDINLVHSYLINISRLFLTRQLQEQQIITAKNFCSMKLYLSNLIDKKLSTPMEDIISQLALSNQLNKAELIQLLFDIISAGFDTTLYAMAWSFYHLLKMSGLWLSMNDKQQLSATVDETLRLNLSQMGLIRSSAIDSIINGILIPKNSLLYVLHTYANRDCSHFSHPEKFDPYRKLIQRQLTFGYGSHYCLGAKLARTEILLAIDCLRKHFPKLRISRNAHALNIRDTGTMKIIDKMVVEEY